MAKEKRKNNNGIFYVAISLVLISLLIATVGVTATQSFEQLLADAVAREKGDEIIAKLGLDEEVELGAFPGGDIYTPVTFYDKVGYGDGRNRIDTFHKIISFADNTTTPVVWSSNDEGWNDFYLLDMWTENTDKATSSLRSCVSTTTAGTLFGNDDITLLTDDAGACTLMRTLGNAFGADGAAYNSETATSSIFSIWRYPGTNTHVANGKSGILINSTTDIFVRATSTGATYDNGLMGNDTFDGKLHIIGIESSR